MVFLFFVFFFLSWFVIFLLVVHFSFSSSSETQGQLVGSIKCCKRFRASSSKKFGREQKKKKSIKGEGGGGEKETLARKTHDFDKLRSLTNAASDWCGAGSVDYLALETSINQSINLQSSICP